MLTVNNWIAAYLSIGLFHWALYVIRSREKYATSDAVFIVALWWFVDVVGLYQLYQNRRQKKTPDTWERYQHLSDDAIIQHFADIYRLRDPKTFGDIYVITLKAEPTPIAFKFTFDLFSAVNVKPGPFTGSYEVATKKEVIEKLYKGLIKKAQNVYGPDKDEWRKHLTYTKGDRHGDPKPTFKA